jgi:hypothetical protein
MIIVARVIMGMMWAVMAYIVIMIGLMSPVHAADSFYVIENFSGMLKSHVSEYMVQDGDATEAQNIRANDEYGVIAKRQKMFNLSACHAAPVKSLYRYYKSDDTKYTIATSSTYIDYVSDAGACTALYASASDGKRWSWITYKDKLIGMNGTNNAKKWDGSTEITVGNPATDDNSRTAGDLMADLGAPFAQLSSENGGNDLDPSAWYQYKVAFLDGAIYSFSNARSNPIMTDSAIYNLSLTDIPLGPSGTDARIIYRTEGKAARADVVGLADSAFYRVTTISDNSTMTYDDSMTDATLLGDSAPTWATVSGADDIEVTPPKSKFSVINQDRLFTANDPSGIESGKSTVYWSDILNPDYFVTAADYDLIRPDDGDEITFIKNLSGILTIGKTRTISKFYTEGASTGWSISDPFSFTGNVAPWSAVNGITGILYLGRYGIYSFNGQNSELVSDVVTDKIRDILETNQDEVVGIYHDNSYYLAYTSSESGSANNDHVLVFDITRNAYVEDTSHIDSFANYDSGDDYGVLYSGSSEVDGSIYAHGESFNALTYRYESQLVDGTLYSVNVGGEENNPNITLGSAATWASESGTWADAGSTTWLLDDLTGEWWSPVVQINAQSLDKLFWNESLGNYGNVTFAIRTGATPGAVTAAAWSSEFTDPTGSDVSGITGNVYIQIRASLTSSVYTETPTVYLENSYVIKMSYRKSGTGAEPAFLSVWAGGRTDFGTDAPKRIKDIQVFYAGTEGTLTSYYTDDNGVTRSFDIDLSVKPSDSATDAYFGTDNNKVFVYVPAFNDQPVVRDVVFKFSDIGTEQWKIKRMVARIETLPYTVRQGAI